MLSGLKKEAHCSLKKEKNISCLHAAHVFIHNICFRIYAVFSFLFYAVFSYLLSHVSLNIPVKQELKSLFMNVTEESEKVGLKLNIQKTKIMASGSITSWQTDGETMEIVRDFIIFSSKITADGDCSHEIIRCLLLGRKAMTNLSSILKSKDITLPTKVYLVKAMAFPIVMYGCESWTIKKAEHQRTDAFELWCWRRLLRTPWTARRSNWSKEISPEYSLEGLMLKLKLPILWPPDVKNWLWCRERLKARGEGDDRGWDGWHHWLNGHEFEQALVVGDGQGSLACCSPWGHKESDTTEWLNWTELIPAREVKQAGLQSCFGGDEEIAAHKY